MPSLRPRVIQALKAAFVADLTATNSVYAPLGLSSDNIELTIIERDLNDTLRRDLPSVEILDNLETDRTLLFGQGSAVYTIAPIIRVIFEVTEPETSADRSVYDQVSDHVEALKAIHVRHNLLGNNATWRLEALQVMASPEDNLVELIASNKIRVEDQELFNV